MKLVASTPLNDAIQRIANGNPSAASIIGLITRKCPDNLMAYLRVMDRKGLYGSAIAKLYWEDCDSNFETFLKNLTSEDEAKAS